MSNCKRKVFELEVTQRRVAPGDPDLLAEAILRWEQSLAMLIELQDKFEAQAVSEVSCIQNSTNV